VTSEAVHYLELECQRLRQLLKRHVAWLRTRWGTQRAEDCQGLAIADGWADLLLERGLDLAGERAFYRDAPGKARLCELESQTRALRAGQPLGRLATAFELTPFDCDLLLLSLAPDLDPTIEILYAYCQDDISRKYATAQLALALFAEDADGRQPGLLRLEEGAPLRRFELLQVETSSPGTNFSARPLRLDDRIRDFLLGSESLDPRLARHVREAPSLPLPAAHRELARDLTMRLDAGGGLNLTGAVDSGKPLVAREVFAAQRLKLLHLDLGRLEPDAAERDLLVRVASREARLAGLAYYVRPPDLDPGERSAALRVQEFIDRVAAPIAVDSQERYACDRNLVVAAVTRPGRESQAEYWRHSLGTRRAADLSAVIDEIVEQFDLGPESIGRAADDALGRSRERTPTPADLWQACRVQTGWRIEDLAQKLVPQYDWEDIVLPADTARQLREVAAQVAHRVQVYERWGFARRIRRGRGISALFAGPSGVGKTMAAEVLARALELDLYRIDLAGVVSKYIGETEKNLRRIFDAAEQSGAILFFDEADALFGKRTEVKDSHDRYANIEVNYLLQRMEEYRGLAILATNRKSALDRAFLRRLRFLIDFPFPDSAHRRQIWARSFPKDAPVGELDFDFLAGLEIAGGNIRNIALNAGFLAAERGGRIEFDDVLRSVRREYSKIDKLVTESEFGRHYRGHR
jgi:hypothetical protein